MTEWEKCIAGEWFDCHDRVFLEKKARARELLAEYHALRYEQKTEKTALLRKLFARIGKNVSVAQPFLCDYGCNISIGNNVSVNMNCTFVDCNRIEIGDNVLIASNVQLYTAAHPVELAERLTPDWTEDSGGYFCRTFARPIQIESGCWIGGGVIVLPGVRIGEGSVIGAGSVVTKDIPANSLAYGNPCRVIADGEFAHFAFHRLLNGKKFLIQQRVDIPADRTFRIRIFMKAEQRIVFHGLHGAVNIVKRNLLRRTDKFDSARSARHGNQSGAGKLAENFPHDHRIRVDAGGKKIAGHFVFPAERLNASKDMQGYGKTC